MNSLKAQVEQSAREYAMGLFLNITGAFDRACWLDMVRLIRETGRCPWLVELPQSYAHDYALGVRRERIELRMPSRFTGGAFGVEDAV